MADTTLIPNWSLGDRLRKAREHAGLTQEVMAKQLRVSRSALAGWENDKHQPTWLALGAWAEITHVPLDWLEGEAQSSTKWQTTLRGDRGNETPARRDHLALAA